MFLQPVTTLTLARRLSSHRLAPLLHKPPALFHLIRFLILAAENGQAEALDLPAEPTITHTASESDAASKANKWSGFQVRCGGVGW